MIADVSKHPEFRKEMEALRAKHCKEPRLFHPQNETAVDDWKYDSGWIAGFQFLYNLLMEPKK